MNFPFPILEYDPQRIAILEPHRSKSIEGVLPGRAVLCFFQEVLKDLEAGGQLKVLGYLKSEIGLNPVYELELEGQRLLVMHPGVGAPLAAGFLEELIVLGVDRVMACGGCGVLDGEIGVGHPMIITAALRDEGTSYHYLPAAAEALPSLQAVKALEQTFADENIDYRLVKSWTTDAIYRETPVKRDRRMAQGCQVVEMEASAFFAVAQFRQVAFGQVVYAGDLVVPEGWDHRGWYDRMSDRQRLFWLTVKACLKL